MSCEHHKDALIEAAATAVAREGELRAHLSECASCRAAFDEEQSLFAAIDSGLHAVANTPVPPSLLPSVRARLDGAVAARQWWNSSCFGLAGAALVAAVLLVTVSIRQNNVRTPPINSAANQPVVPSIVPSTKPRLPTGPLKKADSVSHPHVLAAKISVMAKELVVRESTPEILVPRDQEVLVASYAQQWNSRKRAPLVAGNVDSTVIAPIEVAPIQIDELDVKPLAEGASQ